MKKWSNNIFKSLLFLFITILSFIVLSACSNKDKTNTNDPSAPSVNPTVTVVMTDSYKTNRDNFKTVTGIELPVLEKLEVDEYPYRSGDTNYCFDIISGDNLNYQTYLTFENFFKEKLGACDSGYPTGDEANGRDAQWTKNGRWYQTYWDKTNKAIYINTTLKESDDKQMTTSYSLARDQFKEITYLQLPIVYDVNANETNINAYVAGRKTYELSLESGSNLNYQTYLIFENFFADNFTAQDGYPTGTESTGREARWTFQSHELYTKYLTSGFIVIGVKPVETHTVNMTKSYAQGRTSFYEIAGIWLPEVENLELDSTSTFVTETKSAEFVVAGDSTLFASFITSLKTYLANEPLSNNDNHWEEEGHAAFWEWDYNDSNNEMHKVTIQAELRQTKVYIGYWFRDYNTITLTATTGGSVVLKKSGRAQENNTSYAVIGTYYELYATPSNGYEFVGWYKNNALLSEEDDYGITVKEDMTIEGRFNALPDNMQDDYRAVRNAFYELSGILLPELEDVNTDNEMQNVDEENHVRDEAQAELIFNSTAGISDAYASIKELMVTAYGNPTEDMDDDYSLMSQWSIPVYEATIPYRTEVMMMFSKDSTSIFLMWRRQPIVVINVAVEGNGTGGFVVINNNYEEELFTKSFEILDAFHGTLLASNNDSGQEFLGWYVNNTLLSNDKRYTFNYNKADINFTEITFVAKFGNLEMTANYAQARTSLHNVSNIWLPQFENVSGMYEDLGSNQYMVDINGATQDMLTSVISAFTSQTKVNPTTGTGGKKVWTYNVEKNNKTYNCELSAFFAENMIVVMYGETLPPAMTESYAEAREEFNDFIGVLLPELSGLEVEDYPYQSGVTTSYCFDMFEGDNISLDTFNNYKTFFDNLTGWNLADHNAAGSSTEYYDTYTYSSSVGTIEITLAKAGENGEVTGIFINAFINTVSEFNSYNEAKSYFSSVFNIILPDVEVVIDSSSYTNDASEVTLDLIISDCTQTIYDQFLNAMVSALDNGTNQDDEYQKRTDWQVSGLWYSLTWDLNESVAINISEM